MNDRRVSETTRKQKHRAIIERTHENSFKMNGKSPVQMREWSWMRFCYILGGDRVQGCELEAGRANMRLERSR